MKLSVELVERLLEKYNSYLDDYCLEYGEPGYHKDHADNYILFANWNGLPHHVMSAVEKQFDTEWSDEWITISDTNKAYRTSPDSYGWRPFYVFMDDCEAVGGDEIKEDMSMQARYIEEYLLNSYRKCDMLDLDLEKHGFHQVNGDFESGLHPGQSDNPKDILEHWQKELPNYDFVFGSYSSGQFDCSYNLYGRERK